MAKSAANYFVSRGGGSLKVCSCLINESQIRADDTSRVRVTGGKFEFGSCGGRVYVFAADMCQSDI